MRNALFLDPVVKLAGMIFLAFMVGCSQHEIKKDISTYADGTIKQSAYYTMNGNDSTLVRVTFYYQNGKKSLEAHYVRDTILNGTWTIWYEDGRMNAECLFENGTRKGDWQIWDFEGNKLNTNQYTIDTSYNGLPLVIKYFQEQQGENEMIGLIEFYTNHLRKTEGPVKDNLKHGLWKAWYTDGTKWSEGNFQYDVSHGHTAVWHENGQIFYEGNYQLGKRIRKWTFWDKDGRVLKELDYDAINKQMEQ